MNLPDLKSSVILRMLIVATLTLLLLIPAVFVESLISERSSRRDSATLEVSESWGGAQTLTGPVLSLPFKEFSKDEKGAVSFSILYAHFLPTKLLVKGSVKPEIRYRGIYEVPLYSSQFVIEGQFSSPDLNKLRIDPDNVLWTDAFVSFGITDLKGVRDTINLQWDAARYPSEPGVLSDDIVATGVTFKPHIEKSQQSHAFSFPLSLNGSSEIYFVPMGEVTEVVFDSPWENPSFIGSFLPHTRDISADNFHAEWKVLNLNRNFPQAWIGNRHGVGQSSFGASFYIPVDQYQKTERSVIAVHRIDLHIIFPVGVSHPDRSSSHPIHARRFRPRSFLCFAPFFVRASWIQPRLPDRQRDYCIPGVCVCVLDFSEETDCPGDFPCSCSSLQFSVRYVATSGLCASSRKRCSARRSLHCHVSHTKDRLVFGESVGAVS